MIVKGLLDRSVIDRDISPSYCSGISSPTSEKDIATYTIIKLLLCFLVCYLPGGILRATFFVQSLTPNSFNVLPHTDIGRERFYYVYTALNLVLISLNSMLNPLFLIPNTGRDRERRATKLDILRRDTMSNNYYT